MLEPTRISRTMRELRSLCTEVGNDDPEAFAELVAIRATVDSMIREAAAAQRLNGGYSWADLARPLKVTRAAVQQRYGRSR